MSRVRLVKTARADEGFPPALNDLHRHDVQAPSRARLLMREDRDRHFSTRAGLWRFRAKVSIAIKADRRLQLEHENRGMLKPILGPFIARGQDGSHLPHF